MKHWMTQLTHSLPARLLLVFLVVCLCVITLLSGTLIYGFGKQWNKGVRPHLNQYLSYVNADIGSPPDFAKAEELARKLPINIYIEGPDRHYSSTGLPLDKSELELHTKKHDKRFWVKPDGPPPAHDAHLRFGELQDRTILRTQMGDYTLYYEVRHPEARRDGYSPIAFAVLWLIAVFALSYWVLRRMLNPLREIKSGVKFMGSGQLNYRVPVTTDNDLGELADSINQMAHEIENMLDGKRQLLLALSHELRSPITRANVAVSMLEPSKTTASIADDLNEMQTLISEIIETERMSSQHSALARSPIVIEDLLDQLRLDFSNDSVLFQSDQTLPKMKLDETRIKLLLRNLINNAITHSQTADTAPKVVVKLETDKLIFQVIDQGIGVPKKHLPHLTEAFYRADPSRTRDTGGFGLGLHLCKLIAEAHAGSLAIESTEGVGTKVTVKIPLSEENLA